MPSPEDKPWKQLPASLLSYDKVISQNMLLPAPESNELVPEPQEPMQDKVEILYVNVPEESNCDLNKLDNTIMRMLIKLKALNVTKMLQIWTTFTTKPIM